MTDPINLFGRRSVNADILAQLRGVRPQHMTEEEAMANPSNPNAAPVTIHSEDLREKVARIILGPKSHWNTHFEDDLLIKWPHYPETARALAKADQILSLISSIKEGGTEVLSAVGSGLTPLVPSRVPEPGHATPSLVGQSDIHYITAALSWYDGAELVRRRSGWRGCAVGLAAHPGRLRLHWSARRRSAPRPRHTGRQ